MSVDDKECFSIYGPDMVLNTWESLQPDIKGHTHTHTLKEYKPTVEMRAPCPSDVLSEAASGTNLPLSRCNREGLRFYSFTQRDKEVLQISSKTRLRASLGLFSSCVTASGQDHNPFLSTINRNSLFKIPGRG